MMKQRLIDLRMRAPGRFLDAIARNLALVERVRASILCRPFPINLCLRSAITSLFLFVRVF